MAKTKDLKASRKLLKDIEKFITFLSSARLPDLAKDFANLAIDFITQITRSWCLLYLAPEEDDIGPIEKAVHQTTKEFYDAIPSISYADKAMRDLIPLLHQRNDELSERLTWPEYWYLDLDPFILFLEHLDIVSAPPRSPIKDSARFGAFLRKQTQNLVSTMRGNIPLSSGYSYCDKFALLVESARTADRRGGFHIFHSLVMMVGASWWFDMCITSWGDYGEDCENCPGRRLSQQLLDITAGAVEPRNRYLQFCQDPGSHTTSGISCDSEVSWDFLFSWRSLIGDFKKLLASHPPRHCYGDEDDDDSTCSPCGVKNALPVVRALQRAAVNELTDKVLMVCAARLPVELSNMVVEASLLAEGLPLGPSMWEIVERPRACTVRLFG